MKINENITAVKLLSYVRLVREIYVLTVIYHVSARRIGPQRLSELADTTGHCHTLAFS